MEKSYNQRWKESGTTLTYKEWRRREDEKMASFDGKIPTSLNLRDSVSYQQTQKELEVKGGFKTDISNKTILGINKNIVIVGGILLVGAIAFKVYQLKKK